MRSRRSKDTAVAASPSVAAAAARGVPFSRGRPRVGGWRWRCFACRGHRCCAAAPAGGFLPSRWFRGESGGARRADGALLWWGRGALAAPSPAARPDCRSWARPSGVGAAAPTHSPRTSPPITPRLSSRRLCLLRRGLAGRAGAAAAAQSVIHSQVGVGEAAMGRLAPQCAGRVGPAAHGSCWDANSGACRAQEKRGLLPQPVED
ncbi:hypothetical protein STCU_10443 [Strigomonas culicis]|uniref:Uncharacterized protein n=1 Tax=Strigomonas culicis TaxID=28005 RepID=S9TLP6_9TRYP|nr:hypothetical protein STCU_10443 [Strigomonas culicis]|eukprot:EPY17729.1 hypothetical protein STCU_10443 [Strigomonas culicis]